MHPTGDVSLPERELRRNPGPIKPLTSGRLIQWDRGLTALLAPGGISTRKAFSLRANPWLSRMARAHHGNGRERTIWRAMRDSDENYIYSIALHDPIK